LFLIFVKPKTNSYGAYYPGYPGACRWLCHSEKSPLWSLREGPARDRGFIMLAGVLMKCIVQINPGEIGVKTLFGKVQTKF
jgi:hypothetical protein